MFEVFLSIAPLSLAASVSITSYLLFFNILAAKQLQLRNGLAFIIGGTLTYTVIAVVVMISVGNVTSNSNPHNVLYAVADFLLATTSLVLLFVILREEKKRT